MKAKERFSERHRWKQQIVKENYSDVQRANSTMLNWLLKIGLFSLG